MNTPQTVSDWLIYMSSIHVSAIDMGLSRVLPIADKLGILKDNLPHKPYVFTVAGTNGKGSTTALISETCIQAGYKTALYQSPHLISFNERIKINGEMVSDDMLISAFNMVEKARLDCQLTLSFFEMTTLSAFWIFKELNCDVWVLEIGLGGRLDVVNIIDPDLCVITNVGIDHIDWLGDTREKIGFEKAGILRDNSTLIYGESDIPNSVKTAIANKQVTCYQRDVHFSDNQSSHHTTNICHERDVRCGKLKDDDAWTYSNTALTLSLPKPTISLINASTAISALLASPLSICQNHLRQALSTVKLAGRFDKRWIGGRHFVFDVGHNEHGIRFLIQELLPYWHNFSKQYPNAKLHAIFSMLADKDIDDVLALIARCGLPIQTWHIGKIDNSRATDTATLEQKLRHTLPKASIITYETVGKSALGAVQSSSQADLLLCFGSFHTIGESLIALGAEQSPID